MRVDTRNHVGLMLGLVEANFIRHEIDLLSIKYMETDIYFEYLQVFFFIEPMILNDINLFGLMFSFFPFVSAINK